MIKIAAGLLSAVIILLILAGGTLYLLVRASLPRTRGERSVPGLSTAVTITRDASGVPTIRGHELLDVIRAQGFVHAQERFFQMDCTRRLAAGELAALVGESVVDMDRRYRTFRFRTLAQQVLPGLSEDQRRMLEAYAEGANAGLAGLRVRPPEYLLLRQSPAAWQPEDSILILYAFHLGLTGDLYDLEKHLGSMEAVLPLELFEFLTPSLTRFDAPLSMAAEPAESGYTPQPIPGPEVVDLRGQPPIELPARRIVQSAFIVPGSNSFAAAAGRTVHGGAILGNDPHLDLQLPSLWYRQVLEWKGGRAQGVATPGAPGILIGASEHLAWGATVSMADPADLVVVEVDPADSSRYLTPEGSEAFVVHHEVVPIRGAESMQLEVLQTRWGPVIDHDWRGRPLALRSPMLDPSTVNMHLLEIILADTLEQGIELLGGWYGPSMNWLLADATGRIGWVVNGYLPRRRGLTGKVPRSWRHGDIGWDGVLDESLRPRLVDPPSGVLFTANHRTVHSGHAAHLSQLWAMPYRAYRIQEMLAAEERFSEADFLAMQLDTRSEPLELIRQIVQEVLPYDDPDVSLARVRHHVDAWNGRADTDQPGFRLLHAFYRDLIEGTLAPLMAPVREADPEFVYKWYLADEPLRRILESRPPHLLPPGHADWPAFLRSTLTRTVQSIQTTTAEPAAGIDATWGDVHQTRIRHIFWGRVFAGLSRWVDRAGDPLAGWMHSVRVAEPDFGASMRMVVSPGHEETALFHLPGGPGGHPLSPHYADGYEAWLHGTPRPFEPGAPHRTLTLVP